MAAFVDNEKRRADEAARRQAVEAARRIRQAAGDVLQQVMNARGLTQTQVAAFLRISQVMISRYSHGDAFPSGEALERLAEALGVSPGFFHEPDAVTLANLTPFAAPGCPASAEQVAAIREQREAAEAKRRQKEAARQALQKRRDDMAQAKVAQAAIAAEVRRRMAFEDSAGRSASVVVRLVAGADHAAGTHRCSRCYASTGHAGLCRRCVRADEG